MQFQNTHAVISTISLNSFVGDKIPSIAIVTMYPITDIKIALV